MDYNHFLMSANQLRRFDKYTHVAVNVIQEYPIHTSNIQDRVVVRSFTEG